MQFLLKIFTTLLIGNLFADIHAIDTPSKVENTFSLCDGIKKLDPRNFDPAIWQEYVSKLLQNDLTVCNCIKYISEQREQKALKEVVKEWSLSDEQMTKIANALEATRKRDKESKCEIIYQENAIIAPELKELINKKAHDLNITVPIHVSTDATIKDLACIGRSVSENLDTYEYIMLKLNVFHAKPENVNLDCFDSVIEHELTHVTHNHAEFKAMLLLTINNENWESPLQSASFQKLQRAHEVTADRVGQACCNELKTARNFALFAHAAVNIYKKNGISITDKRVSRTHPTLFKRLLWAIKINNLRNLEETLKRKSEEESKDK